MDQHFKQNSPWASHFNAKYNSYASYVVAANPFDLASFGIGVMCQLESGFLFGIYKDHTKISH